MFNGVCIPNKIQIAPKGGIGTRDLSQLYSLALIVRMKVDNGCLKIPSNRGKVLRWHIFFFFFVRFYNFVFQIVKLEAMFKFHYTLFKCLLRLRMNYKNFIRLTFGPLLYSLNIVSLHISV